MVRSQLMIQLLVVLASFLVAGCAASSVKNVTLSSLDVPFHDVVVINEKIYIVGSDGASKYDQNRFVDALRESGSFPSVEFSSELPPKGSLVINNLIDNNPIKWAGFQCFEPYLLVVSLGLIPAYCDTHHEIAFSIARVGGDSDVKLSFSYDALSIEGWVALIYRISSSWSNESPTIQYSKLLSTALHEKQNDLKNMTIKGAL